MAEPLAFPRATAYQTEGMTMRDYFAAKVLQGFAANPAVFATNGMSGWALVNCTNDELCAFAYHLADAMLRASITPQLGEPFPICWNCPDLDGCRLAGACRIKKDRPSAALHQPSTKE